MTILKEGVPRRNGYCKANVDVLMAKDVLDLVETTLPDVVLMVTGDSDFGSLAEKLRDRSCQLGKASARAPIKPKNCLFQR
jgi:uncharacterized LabA/DUF88 family protein